MVECSGTLDLYQNKLFYDMIQRKLERVVPREFEKLEKITKKTMDYSQRNLLLEISFIFGLLLGILLIFDFSYYIINKAASLTSQWLVSILILHISSCSCSVISFIYANESGNLSAIKYSAISIAFNSLVLLARSVVEYSYQDYKPVIYSQ
eukprot:NODE_43_length_33755_cov_1.178542.p29 type:complete len:151 gc:universal NODE_43_length_33755_cov_1.178542:23379-22927(-)